MKKEEIEQKIQYLRVLWKKNPSMRKLIEKRAALLKMQLTGTSFT